MTLGSIVPSRPVHSENAPLHRLTVPESPVFSGSTAKSTWKRKTNIGVSRFSEISGMSGSLAQKGHLPVRLERQHHGDGVDRRRSFELHNGNHSPGIEVALAHSASVTPDAERRGRRVASERARLIESAQQIVEAATQLR